MTLDEALVSLGESSDPDVVVPALEAAMEAWDLASPRCLALLEDYLGGRDVSEHTERALFFIVHLLGGQCEATAFAPLCRLAADAERASLILGDALELTLPGVLVNCYGGDVQPLQALIENPRAEPYLRADALLVLAFLTQTRRVPRTATHAYLAALFDTLQPQAEDPVWHGLVAAVALLGFGALAAKARVAFKNGFVPPELYALEMFQEDLKQAQLDPASLDMFEHLGIGPFNFTNAEMFEDDPDVPLTDEPYVNPLRNVGRNDPCPCGSGKKFKKCCLA